MMKKIIFYFLIALFFSACEWTEPYEPIIGEEVEAQDIILKSASGFSSNVGDVYLQKGLKTWFSISTMSGKSISQVIWRIEENVLDGQEIVYQTYELGQIPFEVEVEFSDGTSQKKSFAVFSVIDLSTVDPVKAFKLSFDGNKGELLFLFSKERIAHATDAALYYNGSVSDWSKEAVPIVDYNYIIQNGVAERVTDTGKYVGVRLSLEIGEYNLVLVHSDNEWANLSGSSFIKPAENAGLVYFFFDGENITPLGNEQDLYPGNVGDQYFRFSNNENGTVSFYFKFDEELTNNSFVTKRNDDGTYSGTIEAEAVDNFPEWGSYNLAISEISGDVLYLRYGDDKNKESEFSENMENSSFFNQVFGALRLSMNELE